MQWCPAAILRRKTRKFQQNMTAVLKLRINIRRSRTAFARKNIIMPRCSNLGYCLTKFAQEVPGLFRRQPRSPAAHPLVELVSNPYKLPFRLCRTCAPVAASCGRNRRRIGRAQRFSDGSAERASLRPMKSIWGSHHLLLGIWGSPERHHVSSKLLSAHLSWFAGLL